MSIMIYLNDDERYMLRTILDVAREDEADGDEFREEVANFAERLYDLITPPAAVES
jgi:DUF438 domain-containing protein